MQCIYTHLYVERIRQLILSGQFTDWGGLVVFAAGNGIFSKNAYSVVISARIVNKFEIGDEVIVEVIGDNANGILTIHRIA